MCDHCQETLSEAELIKERSRYYRMCKIELEQELKRNKKLLRRKPVEKDEVILLRAQLAVSEETNKASCEQLQKLNVTLMRKLKLRERELVEKEKELQNAYYYSHSLEEACKTLQAKLYVHGNILKEIGKEPVLKEALLQALEPLNQVGVIFNNENK